MRNLELRLPSRIRHSWYSSYLIKNLAHLHIYIKLEPPNFRQTVGHIGSAWLPYRCQVKLCSFFNWPTRIFINNVEDQLNATITIIGIIISSTCFGQFFANPQERKTVFCSMWYNVPQIVAGRWSGTWRR